MKFNADFHNKFFKDEAPPKIYVCKDGLPADFPFEDMPNVGFFTLWNLSGLPKFFQKELEKGISAYYVGIKLTDRQIVIAIGSYGVTLIKKDHIRRGLGDRWIFTYEYSCEKQKWLLAKTE
jgi:hypothetical protein